MNWRSSLFSFNSSGATRRARFSSSFPFPAPVPIPHAPPTDSEQAQMSFSSVGNLNLQETLCRPETSCNTLPKAWNLPQAEQEREWKWSSNMNGRVPATSDRTARHTVLIDTPAALSLPSTKLQTNHEPHIPPPRVPNALLQSGRVCCPPAGQLRQAAFGRPGQFRFIQCQHLQARHRDAAEADQHRLLRRLQTRRAKSRR